MRITKGRYHGSEASKILKSLQAVCLDSTRP